MVRTWVYKGDGSCGIDGEITIKGYKALIKFSNDIQSNIDAIEIEDM